MSDTKQRIRVQLDFEIEIEATTAGIPEWLEFFSFRDALEAGLSDQQSMLITKVFRGTRRLSAVEPKQRKTRTPRMAKDTNK